MQNALTGNALAGTTPVPAAYSSAQTRSLIGVSAHDGSASESIIRNTWDNTTNVYVRVRGVAGITTGGGGDLFTGGAPSQAEESPLPRKAAFVFHFGFNAHQIALEIAAVVDGGMAFGTANFEDEGGLVRPVSGL